ncbi:hypothetical protein RFI_15118 [Reticulomyxa filosa]|uniref:Phosphatidate cytidylyltransferase, mitochondrial n=1 Tax=Reticulomyxa filosa TaxID=46433 RepID=X6N8K7_RETFI|nr:hypothetical protein RFI_15118 [Reticulomyxa filosa]|eukprot:ETO22084.1 hypothetical protein RFI_15118 [Reticulomyxa filosa]
MNFWGRRKKKKMRAEDVNVVLRMLQALFPKLTLSIGYGSNVFSQKPEAAESETNDIEKVGTKTVEENQERPKTWYESVRYRMERPMIDFIFVVDDAYKWHHQNMIKNPSHYSPLSRFLGALFVAHVQSSYGGKIFYNTLIPIEWKDYIIEKSRIRNDMV